MFKRIRCRCGKKVSASFDYCPFCGSSLKEQEKYKPEKEPDNLLDAMDDMGMPFMLRFPFKKLVKQIESQLREIDKEFADEKSMTRQQQQPKQMQTVPFAQGISISINSSNNGTPVIRVKKFGPGGQIIESNENNEKKEMKESLEELKRIKEPTKEEQERLSKFTKLPRHEPDTNVRRLSDRIVYEVSLPGVKNKKDVIITRLQNSIEIKAFTKDRAYFKLIPLSLPIKRQYLEDEKLVLELKPQI